MARQWPHPLGTACTPIHPLDENQMRLVGVLTPLLRNIMKFHERSSKDVAHMENAVEASRPDVAVFAQSGF